MTSPFFTEIERNASQELTYDSINITALHKKMANSQA